MQNINFFVEWGLRPPCKENTGALQDKLNTWFLLEKNSTFSNNIDTYFLEYLVNW